MLKILHLAPQNFAGVPYSFFKMHNQCGDYSRLVTMHRNPLNFPEDICLDFKLFNTGIFKRYRKSKVDKVEKSLSTEARFWKPSNLEKIYFEFTDNNRAAKIDFAVNEFKFNEFEIIHYDGGLDLYRDSRLAKKWKKQGKKIVCCYYGSDLRIRGLIKELDQISDLNLTSEFDHLKLKKDLQYLFYPYDTSELPAREYKENDKIRIVHSPTNRQYKGTELIIEVIEKIGKEKNIEFILLERLPREEVLKIKSSCDIAIDQVGGTMGGTGYGKAGLETLGMKIPTVTNMTDDYAAWLPENPFSVANNKAELYTTLMELIEDKQLRETKGIEGYNWIQKYHSYEAVNKRLKELYKENKII